MVFMGSENQEEEVVVRPVLISPSVNKCNFRRLTLHSPLTMVVSICGNAR